MTTAYTMQAIPFTKDMFSFLDTASFCKHTVYVEIAKDTRVSLHKHFAIQTYLIWQGILHPHNTLRVYIHNEDVATFANFLKEE